MLHNILHKYQAVARLEMDAVLPVIGTKRTRHLFDGTDHPVNVKSLRLLTFKFKGTNCVKCNAVGSHFIIASGQRGLNELEYHLCLVAIMPDGTEVLMTKDHIKPKAKGGLDRLENMQPMCSVCNFEKQDYYEDPA